VGQAGNPEDLGGYAEMTKITDLIELLEVLTAYSGGSYPTYQNVDAINASGTKFILVPAPDGNGSQNTYTVRKYKLQIKATSQANLETAIALIENLGSDVYGSATRYISSSSRTTTLTARAHYFGVLNSFVWTATSPQISPDKFYGNVAGSELNSLLLEFPNVGASYSITAISISYYPTKSGTSGAGSNWVLRFPLTQAASLAAYTTEIGALTTFETYSSLAETFTAETKHTIALTLDSETIATFNTTKAAWTRLDAHFSLYLTDDEIKTYGSADSGKQPQLTITYTIPSTTPYWLTFQFDDDFSTQNQFYATFNVEARWAL